MLLLIIILINLVIIDYLIIKWLKIAKTMLKINDTISKLDYEDDFWKVDK